MRDARPDKFCRCTARIEIRLHRERPPPGRFDLVVRFDRAFLRQAKWSPESDQHTATIHIECDAGDKRIGHQRERRCGEIGGRADFSHGEIFRDGRIFASARGVRHAEIGPGFARHARRNRVHADWREVAGQGAAERLVGGVDGTEDGIVVAGPAREDAGEKGDRAGGCDPGVFCAEIRAEARPYRLAAGKPSSSRISRPRISSGGRSCSRTITQAVDKIRAVTSLIPRWSWPTTARVCTHGSSLPMCKRSCAVGAGAEGPAFVRNYVELAGAQKVSRLAIRAWKKFDDAPWIGW